MDDLIDRLKASARAEGASRIFIHGEKEYNSTKSTKRRVCPCRRRSTIP